MDDDVARCEGCEPFSIQAQVVACDVAGHGGDPTCGHLGEAVGSQLRTQVVEGVVAKDVAFDASIGSATAGSDDQHQLAVGSGAEQAFDQCGAQEASASRYRDAAPCQILGYHTALYTRWSGPLPDGRRVDYGDSVASTEDRGGMKARVLDAALASFGTAGYDSTSLDGLAVGLGIRKQTILYHFVSKRGLLNAVVDRVAEDLTVAMDQVLAGGQRDWERVDALVRSVFRVALEQPVLLGLLREVSRPNSPGAQRLRGHLDPLMARARLWIEAEMAAGRLRRTDAQLLLLSAYSTVVGVATEIEVLRAAGVGPTLRPVVQRRKELLRFLRASLDPRS